MQLTEALSYDKNSSVASLRPLAALLRNAGRFASESLAGFSGIRIEQETANQQRTWKLLEEKNQSTIKRLLASKITDILRPA